VVQERVAEANVSDGPVIWWPRLQGKWIHVVEEWSNRVDGRGRVGEPKGIVRSLPKDKEVVGPAATRCGGLGKQWRKRCQGLVISMLVLRTTVVDPPALALAHGVRGLASHTTQNKNEQQAFF